MFGLPMDNASVERISCALKSDPVHHLWRTVDDEGKVLDVVAQRQRDTAVATKMIRCLLRNQP
ncbi:DDE-type integrase/transposase/recombinase [Brevundimonas sp.]|uniref:DDE-type integrase/transposase/recombinase n=1 Tax=Brevundimonas sp. TaxID=1871086 RepID=UPI003784B0D4